jgi:DNA-binding NarL/FixJ family response regulator
MKILFADDHTLVREGIKVFLGELDDDVQVIEASDYKEVKNIIENEKDFDLVLLDLKMPYMNGFNSVKEMVDIFGKTPVVILSGYHKREYVKMAIECGACGYIPKTLKGKAMINAINIILSGEKYLPSSAFFENSDDDEPLRELEGEKELPAKFDCLSKREKTVMLQLVTGKTNKEIARDLDIQEITIKIHLRNIYRKLNVSNRVQATRLALEN